MSNITHKEVLPEKFLKSVLRKALRASNTLSLVWFTLWRKKEVQTKLRNCAKAA